MNYQELSQIGFYLVVLLSLAVPLGRYMAHVYEGKETWLSGLFQPIEGLVYKVCGIDSRCEMSWKTYASAMLVFNGIGLFALYLLQRLQGFLPLNPQGLGAVPADCAFNTAVSFASNTNWQSYGGEVTMSYLTQMLGLTVQNFVSAATGMAVLVALLRGFIRQETATVGNFWSDLTRSIIHILLPLSIVLSIALVSQGVIQTWSPYRVFTPIEKIVSGAAVDTVEIPGGPAASQIAIKQLGTNGGGFFNVNSSHPLENPTPFSNLLEVLAILLIPVAFCHTFGAMVKDQKQGWAILGTMTIIFISCLALTVWAETTEPPAFTKTNIKIDTGASVLQGNLEGKEVRFGVANSALWAVATTAASNGSVNSMHDSYTPLGGLAPLLLMQLGEVVYGGVGSGLYGMIVFAIIAVFVSGLMVGRTPEYLGKKIEAFEMKMASLVILIPPALVLLGVAVAVSGDWGRASIMNPGAHGFSEVLYAFSSASNNNGSAFAGLNANTPFYNYALGTAMFFARYWLAIPTLAIAGSLARKRVTPSGAGTLPTHGILFVLVLLGVILVVGALTFFPALALGPIVEHIETVSQ